MAGKGPGLKGEIKMAVDTEVTNYEERMSKDGNAQFTICYVDGLWDVDCWKASGDGQFNDNHWHQSFRDEAKARAEYIRFD